MIPVHHHHPPLPHRTQLAPAPRGRQRRSRSSRSSRTRERLSAAARLGLPAATRLPASPARRAPAEPQSAAAPPELSRLPACKPAGSFIQQKAAWSWPGTTLPLHASAPVPAPWIIIIKKGKKKTFSSHCLTTRAPPPWAASPALPARSGGRAVSTVRSMRGGRIKKGGVKEKCSLTNVLPLSWGAHAAGPPRLRGVWWRTAAKDKAGLG